MTMKTLLSTASLALLLAIISTLWLGRLFKRWLGGYTGDCLGASNQLVEIAVLVIFCAFQFPS